MFRHVQKDKTETHSKLASFLWSATSESIFCHSGQRYSTSSGQIVYHMAGPMPQPDSAVLLSQEPTSGSVITLGHANIGELVGLKTSENMLKDDCYKELRPTTSAGESENASNESFIC